MPDDIAAAGLMIYILYSFMGDALGSQLNVADDFQPRIRTVELSDSMKELLHRRGCSQKRSARRKRQMR